MEKNIVEKFIISKEDLEKNLNCKKVITKCELEKYYLEKNVINLNAIFNATPR